MEYDGGQYESSCSRSSRFGAFSGCRIGRAGGVPPLRLRTLGYGYHHRYYAYHPRYHHHRYHAYYPRYYHHRYWYRY